MVMNDTFCFLLQYPSKSPTYMAQYLDKNRDRINAVRRERYKRGRLAEQQLTEEEKAAKKTLNYYYRNHEKCKAYARNYAKSNYQKNKKKILERKRIKRHNEKIAKKKLRVEVNTWHVIPLIAVSNDKLTDKLTTIAHLL